MLGAEEREVVQVGPSSLRPGHDVVDLAHPVRPVTAWSGAGAVTCDERLTDLGGCAALAVAEIQFEARPVAEGGEDVGIAEQTPGGNRCDGRRVVDFAAAAVVQTVLECLGVDEHHHVDVGAEVFAVVVAELARPSGHVHQSVGVALGAGELGDGDAVGVGVLGTPAGFGQSSQLVLEQGELIGGQHGPQAAHAVVRVERRDAARAALPEIVLGAVVAADPVGPAAQEATVVVHRHRLGGADQVVLLLSGGEGRSALAIGEVHGRVDVEVDPRGRGYLRECLRVAVGHASVRQRLAHRGQIVESLGRAAAGKGLTPGYPGVCSQPACGVDGSCFPGHIAARGLGQHFGFIGVGPRPQCPHRPQADAQLFGAAGSGRLTPQHP